MNSLEDIKNLIDEANTIALAGHVHADGDAVGSVGAMYHFLKEIGKEVYMVLPNLEDNFFFLPGIEKRVEVIPLNEYDLLICLDVSDENRINIVTEDINKAKKIAIIDHHRNNQIKSDARYINEDAPANCENIYDLIKYMGHNFTKNVAEYIYMGIMTDTGSFNFERTSSKTHNIAGQMIDAGADAVRTCKLLNHTYSETRMKLLSSVICNMESYCNGKIRIAVTKKETMEELKTKEQDVQSIVNYLKGIEKTVVAIYIRALNEGGYKVSVRTSEPIDASELCSKFGGGGHKRAAGFSTDNIDEIKIKLIEILEGLLESENNRNT